MVSGGQIDEKTVELGIKTSLGQLDIQVEIQQDD
jgi:hypothetical protein